MPTRSPVFAAACAVLLALPATAALAAPDMLVAQAAQAQAAPAVMLTPPNAKESEAFVHALADRAIQSLTQPSIPEPERARRFRELYTTNFDLENIARFVLGRFWKKATEAERTEFLKLFEDITVFTWAGRFREYSGQTLVVRGVTPGADGEVVVDSTVNQRQGPPLSVTWKLIRTSKGIRVTDLVVEGVSMAVTYRSEYAAVLQRANGEISGLLAALRTKVSELTSGKAVQ